MFEFKIYVPRNSNLVSVLLMIGSCIFASTLGYDAAIMTGFNIMPDYATFFHLHTVSKSVLTACYFVGAICACFISGTTSNILGRKNTILASACVKIVGIVLMSAANGYGMFLAGRIILGFGSGISGTAIPTWLSETLPYKRRATGLSFVFAVYYVGSMTAAGVTYGTSTIPNNNSWRIPAAVQVIWSLLTFVILGFTPESPRWLVYNGRPEEALEVIAITHSNGDVTASETILQYQEIIDTIKWEKDYGETLTFLQMFKTRSSRKRILLVFSVAVFTTLSGNNTISYFLGAMLTAAGITNSHTQLEINIILSAWNFICALIGSQMADRVGRKGLAMISCGCCIVFLFLVGALTKLYGSQTENQAGIYATVAMIFLFQGTYSIGFTNLTSLYPPEVLNYSIRANGVAFFTANNFILNIFTIFALPIGLAHIGYKLYFINAIWDILQFIFIYYVWVETNGKTLEEIDEQFDGEKHSDVPDMVNVDKEMMDEKTMIVQESKVN